MIRRQIVILLGLSVTGICGLSWEETALEKKAGPADKECVASFHFKNTGAKTIKVNRVETGCDCLKAEAGREEYAPGETGEIRVAFAVAGRVGLQRKSFQVSTNDTDAPKTGLSLTVNIEQPVELSPSVLWWQIGSERTPRKIHVKLPEGQPKTFKQVECSDPAWRVELRAITPGREYEVEATPPDTAKAASALITLKSEDAQAFTARLRVQ